MFRSEELEEHIIEGQFIELTETSPDLGRAASLFVSGAMAFAAGPVGILALLATQAPVWRVPGNPEEGVGFWDYVYQMMYCVEHLPIEQAIEEAREYYLSEIEE